MYSNLFLCLVRNYYYVFLAATSGGLLFRLFWGLYSNDHLRMLYSPSLSPSITPSSPLLPPSFLPPLSFLLHISSCPLTHVQCLGSADTIPTNFSNFVNFKPLEFLFFLMIGTSLSPSPSLVFLYVSFNIR